MGLVAISLSSLIVDRRGWIDLVVVGAFLILFAVANQASPDLATDADSRDDAFTGAKEAVSGGLTTAGILLPLSLAALSTFAASRSRSIAGASVFIGDTWLAISLAFGLGVLLAAALQAPTRNVLNLGFVRYGLAIQYIFLLVAIFRLLVAVYELANR